MKTYRCAKCHKGLDIEDSFISVIDNDGNVFCDESCFCDFYMRAIARFTEESDFIDEEDEEDTEEE